MFGEKLEPITSFNGKFDFLSNFYPEDWTSVEHKYQAEKTSDSFEKVKIWLTKTPREARKLGRKSTIRPDWTVERRIEVMFAHVWWKFYGDPSLREKLIATDGRHLCEGNDWHDNFFGDCHCSTKPGRFGVRETCAVEGRNELGKILMQVRASMIVLRDRRLLPDVKVGL